MSKKTVNLSQAIEGYTINAHARRLSPNTLAGYEWAYRRLETFLETDRPIARITSSDIRAFRPTSRQS